MNEDTDTVVEVDAEGNETVVEVIKKARQKFVIDEARLSLLVKAIDENGGETSSKLAEITGLDSKEVRALLKHLRAAEVVKMTGTKRGARYFKA